MSASWATWSGTGQCNLTTDKSENRTNSDISSERNVYTLGEYGSYQKSAQTLNDGLNRFALKKPGGTRCKHNLIHRTARLVPSPSQNLFPEQIIVTFQYGLSAPILNSSNDRSRSSDPGPTLFCLREDA